MLNNVDFLQYPQMNKEFTNILNDILRDNPQVQLLISSNYIPLNLNYFKRHELTPFVTSKSFDLLNREYQMRMGIPIIEDIQANPSILEDLNLYWKEMQLDKVNVEEYR